MTVSSQVKADQINLQTLKKGGKSASLQTEFDYKCETLKGEPLT